MNIEIGGPYPMILTWMVHIIVNVDMGGSYYYEH